MCSAPVVKAGRSHVALSYPSNPRPRQTLPGSVWKPLQRLPSQAEALPDAGPACPSHCQVFTCSVCQETFRRRTELRVHMVSHTGEMPYKVRPSLSQAHGLGGLYSLLPGVVSGSSPLKPAFVAHPVTSLL